MLFDPTIYPYPSIRNTLFSSKGMVCTSTPQAAQAGLEILKQGGNAIDAAIATAACLTVVEPMANGIGGDAFAVVWTKGKLYGLNASGYSCKNLTLETLKKKGYIKMPHDGWDAVIVPGAPAGWAELSRAFGKLPFSRLFERASEYAEEGYPVAINVVRGWKGDYANFKKLSGDEYRGFFEEFTIDGRPPEVGEIFRNKNMARTLREIGETNAESFYRGRLAEEIVAYAKKTGGYMSEEDLGEYRPEWVDPISVNYRGYDIYEIPPNGQGIVALMALNLLKGFDMGDHRDRAEVYHRQIEALKLAFADATTYVTDPREMKVKVAEMLSDEYADERRKLITDTAVVPKAGRPCKSGTVYLCTADVEGNMVSFIQSNYDGFGSGVVVPGTGISLHNRGNNFTLDENHDNCYAPRKKPYHTIIPGFIMKDGKPVGPFGVMGAFMQPQGHVQVVCNMLDFHLNPQACLDAPRWQWMGDNEVEVEHSVQTHIIKELVKRGHKVRTNHDWSQMGRGQIIWRLDNGVYCGGTEPRTDSSIALW